MAMDMQDEDLMPKVVLRDLIEDDRKYHLDCYTKYKMLLTCPCFTG